MKPAVQAMMISTLAFVASMIIGDMIVSLLTIAASVFKVAQAYDAHLRRDRPVCVRPYRFQFMR